MSAEPGPGRSGEQAPGTLARRSLRSADGFMEVRGSDTQAGMIVLRWAESVAARLERALRDRTPADKGRIRILLGTTDPGNDPAVACHVENGRRVYVLSLGSATAVRTEDAEAALCRLLLCIRIEARRTGPVLSFEPPEIPAWLWRGMAGHLDRARRSRSTTNVLEAWQQGRLTALGGLLGNQTSGAAAVADPDVDLCVVFVGWLAALPGQDGCFGEILDRLAQGGRTGAEWMAALIPGCENAGDMDERWDLWLLGRRRTVLEPGVVTPQAIRQLRAELLLYAGDFGMPLWGNPGEAVTFGDLIERRSEDWIPALAAGKRGRLGILAVGRGDAFEDVVAAYTAFLDALAGRSDSGRLAGLLRDAENRLGVLEDKVLGPAAGEGN